MAGVGTLWVELKAKTAAFAAAMKESKDAIGEVTDALAAVGKAAGIASLALAGVGALAVKAASDFEQTGSLLDRVFGKGAKEAKSFARATSDNLGVALQEVTQGVASVGAQLKNALGNPEAALKQAKAINVLAADISAAMNIPFAETLERLQSGLRGEGDAVEKLNIFISEGALKQEALRLGIHKSTEKMTEQEKVQLRLAAIYRQTSDLTGAAAAEAATFAGQLSRLDAGVKNLAIDFGRELLPAATSLLTGLNGLIGFIRDMDPGLKALIAKGGALAAVLLGVVAAVAGTAVAVATAAAGFASLSAALAAPAAAAFVGAMGPVLGTMLAIAVAVASVILLIGALKYAWDRSGTDMQDMLKDLAENIGETFGGVLNSIVDLAEKLISVPIKMLGLFAKQLAVFVQAHAALFDMIPGMGGVSKGLGDIGFDIDSFANAALDFQVDLKESFAFGAFMVADAAEAVGDFVADGLSGALTGLGSIVDSLVDETKKAAATVAPPGGAGGLPTDGPGKHKSQRFLNEKLGTEMASGFDKLIDLVNDAGAASRAWAQTLASSAPEITASANALSAKFKEARDAAEKSKTSGETLALVMDALREGHMGALAAATQQAVGSVGSAAAFAELRKQTERLGIQFEDVADNIKQMGFDAIQSDSGPGIAGGVAKGVFDSIRGAFDAEGQGSAKALAEQAGGAASSLMGGGLDLGGIAGVMGAAVGSVLPGVGTAIGSQVAQTLVQLGTAAMTPFIEAGKILGGIVIDFIGSDPRVQAAGEAAFAVGSAFAAAAIPIYVLTVLLAPFIGAVVAITAAIVAQIAIVMAVVVAFSALFAGVAAFVGAVLLYTAAVIGAGPAYLMAFAALGKMVMETEGAKKAMEVISLVVDRVVQALEPFGRSLMSVAGLFSMVVDVMMPFIETFGESQGAMLLLFTVLKTVAVVLGTFVIAIVEVGNVMFRIVEVMASAMSAVVEALMPLFELAGMGDAAKGFKDNLDAAAQAAGEMGRVPTSEMKAALEELAGSTMDGAKDIARNIAGKNAAERAKAAKEEARRKAEEAAKGTTDPLKGLTEGIFNAVADFKVEAYRYASMDATPRAPEAQGGGRNILEELKGLVLKGGTSISIENLNLGVSNADDLVDQLQKIGDQRNFESTGTKAKAGRSRPYGR